DISGAGTHEISISNNFLQNNHNLASNAGFGVHVASGSISGPVHLTQNSITGNFIGLQNQSAIAVDAALNWWGSANGPAAVGNTHVVAPKGDAVAGNVTDVPWLTDGTDT